jgi:hypothetical protein
MPVYAINFEAMMDDVADMLEVERPDDYHTDARLSSYINKGLIETAKRTRAVQVTKFLFLSAGVARYSLPDDSLRGQISQVLYLKNGSLSGAQYSLKKLDRRGLLAVTTPASSGALSSVSYVTPAPGSPLYYLLDGPVIEFRPIPTSATAGANRICFKAPGIPDMLTALSAVPEMALEHRNLPILYATHLGLFKDKDPRADDMLAQFKGECEQVNSDIKWADQEDPPAMQPEDWYPRDKWSIK